MDRHLHIITHEFPWPADYGGRMDLFHKIVSLHKSGINVHLHSFSKAPVAKENQELLSKYCVDINIYPRKIIPSPQDILLPYIVSSRKSHKLVQNLLKDEHPVLMEGIHCTSLMGSAFFQNRKLFLRAHNVEFIYYRQLAKWETSIFRKLYFMLESKLLKRYEKNISKDQKVFCVSELDQFEFHRCFGHSGTFFLPVFTGFKAEPPLGKGNYALYQGNLSINENIRAVEFLIESVFNKEMNIPLVIAGRHPVSSLKQLIAGMPHIRLVEDPDEATMEKLLREAHVHVLPSMNQTGVKLKLLHALHAGRFILCNQACVKGSGLDLLCRTAEDPVEWKYCLEELFRLEFTSSMKEERIHGLKSVYDNERNAEKLIRWIY